MNSDGTDCKKVVDCTGVKSFDWSPDSKELAYVSISEGKKDKLTITNLMHGGSNSVQLCEDIVIINKILYSPDQKYIAYIGSDRESDHIYLYQLKKEILNNLTQNTRKIAISDFIWNTDSSKMFYCAKDMFYYNIYSHSLKDNVKSQLTFTTAVQMELDYRPKIY
jgi:Tol biopolymer transport system component